MNKDIGMTIFTEDGKANMSDDTPWKTPDQGASTYVGRTGPSVRAHQPVRREQMGKKGH